METGGRLSDSQGLRLLLIQPLVLLPHQTTRPSHYLVCNYFSIGKSCFNMYSKAFCIYIEYAGSTNIYFSRKLINEKQHPILASIAFCLCRPCIFAGKSYP